MNDQQAMPDNEAKFYPQVREVSVKAPLTWLKKGWEDIKSCPHGSLFYGVCFVLGGYIMVFALKDAPQYIAAVMTGFVIMGPFLALGLYELSAQRERGEKCKLLPSMMACRRNIVQMASFAGILLLLYLSWVWLSVFLFALYYEGEIPTLNEFLRHIVLTDQFNFLFIYFGLGAVFALIIFAITLITIPLIKDKQMDAISAAFASSQALYNNPYAMIVWSGVIAVISMFGVVTLLLGTIVAGPLLGHATWHAYRDITGTTQDS